MPNGWKRLERKTVYRTPFLSVHEDTVDIGNGKIINDYSVVEKPSVVMVVATTDTNELIVLNEYKYAIDETIPTLPAGHVKDGEDILEAGKRELLEETGFSSNDWQYITYFNEYPTKDMHKIHIVRAVNVSRTATEAHEETEVITWKLVPVDEAKAALGDWHSASVVAAISIAL